MHALIWANRARCGACTALNSGLAKHSSSSSSSSSTVVQRRPCSSSLFRRLLHASSNSIHCKDARVGGISSAALFYLVTLTIPYVSKIAVDVRKCNAAHECVIGEWGDMVLTHSRQQIIRVKIYLHIYNKKSKQTIRC